KFEVEVTPIVLQYNIPFLITIYQTELQDSINQHKSITNVQFYSKIASLAHKIIIKTVKERDLNIINLFESYLKNDELKNELDIDDDEKNKENNFSNISNSNKKNRSKG
ncbi:750_t:CDS:1, partial [Funneliformis caledonium]